MDMSEMACFGEGESVEEEKGMKLNECWYHKGQAQGLKDAAWHGAMMPGGECLSGGQ